MARLYTYKVRYDFGFAPNPFFGVCTLATCKPKVRFYAEPGDFVVGTGAKDPYELVGHVVYAMRVTEELSFDAYWADPRFARKRPDFRGSLKQAFGDNIYRRDAAGKWLQAPSHHSLDDGRPNPRNIARDIGTDCVLISEEFVYWGGSGPAVPQRFRDWDGIDVCANRAHKCRFPDELVHEFVGWLYGLGECGYRGSPAHWDRKP